MTALVAATLMLSSLNPARLQCESLVDPLGIDVDQPLLSWVVTSDETGQRQTAYRVLVASSISKLERGIGDLWDSGKVASSVTSGIRYGGKALAPACRVFWNVQVWDKHGRSSSTSPVATWTMHILSDHTWKPRWIGLRDQPFPRKGIGYHALEDRNLDDRKWVQVDLGKPTRFDQLVLCPVLNHGGEAVFGFPERFQVQISDEPDFAKAETLVDHTGSDFRLPSNAPLVLPARRTARYVRVVATRLWARRDGVGCFALSELKVLTGTRNVALGRPVSALDSVERDDWTRPALTDGWDRPSEPITLLVRKGFRLNKPIGRALCFVTGLGQYEMRLNGKRVGEDWITPGWTQYQKSVLVDSYDVTSLLRKGANAVGIHIGNGMYNMSTDSRGAQQQNSLGTHKALCRIRVEYRDGTITYIDTDATWKCHPGPEPYSGVFGGEDWDARLDPAGWDSAGFDDTSWTTARVLKAPSGRLRGITHAAPPIRTIEVRTPVMSTRPKATVLVLDLAQNAPYVPQIQVRGARGATIKMSPAEILDPEGMIDQRTMRQGKFASYTLDGRGIENWHPLFWYVGSRYWQIEAFDPQGRPIDPGTLLLSFKGLLVHSSARPVGSFECSNELLNRIYLLIRWAIRSNLASVISDCPHREKSGWLEEDHLNGPGLMYCYDLTAMFRKVVCDMADTQQPNGMVPTMAPEYFIYEKGFRDSVEWGGNFLFLPRFMHQWYDDRGVLRDHYAGMKRYVDYLGTRAENHILSNGLGDWTGYGNDPRTPVAITDTAYYYYAVSSLAEFAAELGYASDLEKYGKLAEAIGQAFESKFLDPATGKIGTGSQSGQATALDLGLVSPPYQQKAFAQLLKDVEEHDYAVSCGEIGHPSLLRMLAAYGRSDVIARIHLQTEKPGYGFQIQKGMTTLTEAWDASPISLNHFMMGHLMEWLYGDLVGIRPDPASPGFRSFIVRPQPVPQVSWAKASYDSVSGQIACSWKTTGGQFALELDVPANCTATVYVPPAYSSGVQVIDRSTGKELGVKRAASEGIAVPSGHFRVLSASG